MVVKSLYQNKYFNVIKCFEFEQNICKYRKRNPTNIKLIENHAQNSKVSRFVLFKATFTAYYLIFLKFTF